MSTANETAPNAADKKLGTFAGVFTPSILTILGLILFLKLQDVVGGAGLGQAFIIILIANLISILTSMSVAAVATNLKVKSGGDYYLISRTLGRQFGGAIGLVLFCAQSVSVGFYCIGFAQVTGELLQWDGPWAVQAVAAVAVSGLFVLAWLGSDWASRFQYIIMAVMASALISFFWGAFDGWNSALLEANWDLPENATPFWLVFALFFPAVTGFTQGVSMSGDLREPSKSIPLGSFLAIGISLVVYMACAVALAGAQPLGLLADDANSMRAISIFGPLIDAGIVAATLSSALASFLGAPRILQALAQDRIFPILKPFARGTGPSNNPRRGVMLSSVIALSIVAIGSLDLVAAIVSMFFLVSYGLLNYATYYEGSASSPSFRPRFRWFDRRLSLLGAMGCLGAMLAIDVWAGMAAMIIMFGIFQYLKHRAGPARWADSQRSYHLQQVREHLHGAAAEIGHPRDWRPQLLVFSDDPARRLQLVRFASWVEGGSGLTTVVRLIEGDGEEVLEQREAATNELARELKEAGSKAFPLVVCGENLDQAAATVIQSAGVGPLRVNTTVANWFTEGHGFFGSLGGGRHTSNLQTTFRLGCNLLILDVKNGDWEGGNADDGAAPAIDVWWAGTKTGELMLLLAYLMSRAEHWENAKLRLLAAAEAGQSADQRRDELQKMLEDFRIEAEPVVVEEASAQVIAANSRDSAIVFVPITIREFRCYLPFGGEVGDLLPNLRTVVMTIAAQDVDLDAEPESGKVGESAATRDRVADAEECLSKLEAIAEQADEKVFVEGKVLAKLREENASEETVAQKRAVVEKAKREADRARRRAEKVLAFKQSMEQHLEDVANGVDQDKSPDPQGTGGEGK